MGEDKRENEFPSENDYEWIRALTSTGDSIRINKSIFIKLLLGNLTRLEIKEDVNTGPGLLDYGTGIVLALDLADINNYILYYYAHTPEQRTPLRAVIIANNLSLGGYNEFGTSVILGGVNVKQYCIHILI